MVTWADIEGNPENNDDLMDLFDGKSNRIVDRKDLNGNYTLQEEDADHLLMMTQEGDVTVPADELPVNSSVVLTKSTGDDVHIIAGSGVTFLPSAGGYVIPEEWIFITLFHASQNTWVLQGTVSDDLQSLLDEKADKAGDSGQQFQVADAEQGDEAVNLGQLSQQLTNFGRGLLGRMFSFGNSHLNRFDAVYSIPNRVSLWVFVSAIQSSGQERRLFAAWFIWNDAGHTYSNLVIDGNRSHAALGNITVTTGVNNNEFTITRGVGNGTGTTRVNVNFVTNQQAGLQLISSGTTQE